MKPECGYRAMSQGILGLVRKKQDEAAGGFNG